jgi:hypothetical protein
MRPVRIILLATMREVEAEDNLDLSAGSAISKRMKTFATKNRTGNSSGK